TRLETRERIVLRPALQEELRQRTCLVPVTNIQERQVTVRVPEWKDVQRQETVCVPEMHEEIRSHIATVVISVPEKVYSRVCSYERVSVPICDPCTGLIVMTCQVV